MPRRVAGGRNECEGAVAKYIMIARKLHERLLPGRDQDATERSIPIGFRPLNQQRGFREQGQIAGMVEMSMRDRDILDIRGRNAELIELARERFGSSKCQPRIRPIPFRYSCDRVRYPGVPKQPALGMLDEVAIDGELCGLPGVDAGRPERNVARD